jgi:hypothetical protein
MTIPLRNAFAATDWRFQDHPALAEYAFYAATITTSTLSQSIA